MRLRSFSFLIAILLVLTGCDSAGDEPGAGSNTGSALVGSYNLVSLQDKTGEITQIPDRTLLAGVPNPITIPTGPNAGVLVTFVVTGELVLTGQSFTLQLTIVSTADGQSSRTEESQSGTYTVDGTTLRLNPDFENEDAVLTWSLVQGRLTLSDAESVLVFQKR